MFQVYIHKKTLFHFIDISMAICNKKSTEPSQHQSLQIKTFYHCQYVHILFTFLFATCQPVHYQFHFWKLTILFENSYFCSGKINKIETISLDIIWIGRVIFLVVNCKLFPKTPASTSCYSLVWSWEDFFRIKKPLR